jgi:hypothetical protein
MLTYAEVETLTYADMTCFASRRCSRDSDVCNTMLTYAEVETLTYADMLYLAKVLPRL